MANLKYNSRTIVLFLMIVFCSIGCKKESAFQKKERPEIIISADDPRLQDDIIHFYKDTVYILATHLNREAGQSIVLDAGSLVKVNNNLAITIQEGAKIEARGTARDPIIFTSSAGKGGVGAGSGTIGSARYWYGIRIFGDYLSNPASTGSGALSYVRVEFAGGDENFAGTPALLLQDLAQPTVLENIQVSYSYETSSFGFYGGNCNAVNLVSYASGRSDFDIGQGYKGKLQNLLAYRHPYFPTYYPGPDFAGLFIRDQGTFPIISNFTAIGPDGQHGTSLAYENRGRVGGVITTGGCKFQLRNAVVAGFPETAFYMNDRTTALSLNSGESGFSHSIVHSLDTSRVFYLPPNVYPPFTSSDFKQYILEPQFSNELYFQSAAFALNNPFDYDGNPDPLPRNNSPLLTGTDFSGVFADPFFKKVSYRGALGTENWLRGWTNFIPLQTDYNN